MGIAGILIPQNLAMHLPSQSVAAKSESLINKSFLPSRLCLLVASYEFLKSASTIALNEARRQVKLESNFLQIVMLVSGC